MKKQFDVLFCSFITADSRVLRPKKEYTAYREFLDDEVAKFKVGKEIEEAEIESIIKVRGMSLVSCITLYFNRAEEGKGFQGEEVGQIYAPGQGEGREEATVPADAGETSVGPMP